MKIRSKTVALTALVLAVLISSHATARESMGSQVAPRPMAEGSFVLAPFSYTKFCLDYPAECPVSGGAARVRMTSARMAELQSVNAEVNASIVPTPDHTALRLWALNVSQGDCNEFAVQKRHDLIARGWPAAALALAVVTTSRGEGHLVLSVRTDAGDFVLDNLKASIVTWERAGYTWIMRQSERDPQFWVALNGGRPGRLSDLRSREGDEQVASPPRVGEAASARTTQTTRAGSVDVSSPEKANAVAAPATSSLRQMGAGRGRGFVLGFDPDPQNFGRGFVSPEGSLAVNFPSLAFDGKFAAANDGNGDDRLAPEEVGLRGSI